MKGLSPSMAWVYKLLVMSSQILEFPVSLPVSCGIYCDLLDGEGVTIYLGNIQQLALYNQLIWTILGHLSYTVLKALER